MFEMFVLPDNPNSQIPVYSTRVILWQIFVVGSSKTYLYLKCLIFLSDFNKFFIFIRNILIKVSSIKIH